jgi:hypothetical protein
MFISLFWNRRKGRVILWKRLRPSISCVRASVNQESEVRT